MRNAIGRSGHGRTVQIDYLTQNGQKNKEQNKMVTDPGNGSFSVGVASEL